MSQRVCTKKSVVYNRTSKFLEPRSDVMQEAINSGSNVAERLRERIFARNGELQWTLAKECTPGNFGHIRFPLGWRNFELPADLFSIYEMMEGSVNTSSTWDQFLNSPWRMRFWKQHSDRCQTWPSCSASAVFWDDQTRSYSRCAVMHPRYWSWPSTWDCKHGGGNSCENYSLLFFVACMIAKFQRVCI